MFFRAIFLFLLVTCAIAPATEQTEETLFEEIFQEHLPLLPYINEPHPKLLILLSGTPGMGKTVIAKKIEEHFHALRPSRDEARSTLSQYGLWTQYGGKDDGLLHRYFTWLLVKLSKCSVNQLIILDCKCHTKYDFYNSFSQKHNYDPFLIRIVVEREVVEERIRSRGKDVEAFLQDLDEEWQNYERFSQEPDHIFYNGKDLEEPLKLLFEHIHQKLEKYENT